MKRRGAIKRRKRRRIDENRYPPCIVASDDGIPIADRPSSLCLDDLSNDVLNKILGTVCESGWTFAIANTCKRFREVADLLPPSKKKSDPIDVIRQLGLSEFVVLETYGFRRIREKACEFAVNVGNADALRYAHENGCPWNEDTCSAAAENGHLDCLRYARENGCPDF